MNDLVRRLRAVKGLTMEDGQLKVLDTDSLSQEAADRIEALENVRVTIYVNAMRYLNATHEEAEAYANGTSAKPFIAALSEYFEARNGTKTDRESATPPAGSATDGAGDAAKPLK